MFFNLFRIKRKSYSLFKKITVACKIFELRKLYPKRFLIGNGVNFGKNFSIYYDISFSSIMLGNNIEFRDYCQLRSGLNGKLKIGNNTFFNNNCSLICFNEITIGNNCQFGEGVKFYDHNHEYTSNDKNINEQGYSIGKIVIGNNCWFGTNVVVLKNVIIGDNVVIGAGCVIYKSVPANTIVINKQNLEIKNRFS